MFGLSCGRASAWVATARSGSAVPPGRVRHGHALPGVGNAGLSSGAPSGAGSPTGMSALRVVPRGLKPKSFSRILTRRWKRRSSTVVLEAPFFHGCAGVESCPPGPLRVGSFLNAFTARLKSCPSPTCAWFYTHPHLAVRTMTFVTLPSRYLQPTIAEG